MVILQPQNRSACILIAYAFWHHDGCVIRSIITSETIRNSELLLSAESDIIYLMFGPLRLAKIMIFG